MYDLSGDETLEILADLPPLDVGAPQPIVLSSDLDLVLAYWVSSAEADKELQALVRFVGFDSMMFGMPNDEALNGHPLYGRGLGLYGAYRVSNSGWIRELEMRNSVHPNHDATRYAELEHFIFTFHDSCFECVARGYEVKAYEGYARERLVGELAKYIR